MLLMKRRSIVIFIVLILVAILVLRITLLIVNNNKASSRGFSSPPVAVEAVPVSIESIQETRRLTGTIFPQYQYIVAPKVSGRVVTIRKNIGDWVDEGETIAKLEDAEYYQASLEAQANLKISQATLAEVESQYALASQELERVKLLQEKGIASPAELDAAISNYTTFESRIKLANAQVEQRKAALNSSRIRLTYTTLTASKSGWVGERYVDVGNLLSPNAPLALIVGIDTVIVRTTVVERVYGQIRPDQDAEVYVDAFPDRSFHGRVTRIAPMLQEASRVAQMEVEVANDSLLLKPGMFCNIDLILSEKESTQVVPTKAVVSRAEITGVFIIDPNEPVAHFVPVETGISNIEKTEIISPQLEGSVVTLGQHLLQEGSKVVFPGKQPGKEKMKEPQLSAEDTLATSDSLKLGE